MFLLKIDFNVNYPAKIFFSGGILRGGEEQLTRSVVG